MNEMFSEFKSSSKSDWLSKISTDLKGRDIKELFFEINGIEVNPFPHVDDLTERGVPLPKHSNKWQTLSLIHI